MLARCARCQGTFTTDHYGRQTCPHCGSELLLADPNEPRPTAPAAPEGFAPPPAAGGGWSPPPPPGGGWSPPPPPGPPPPEPDLPSPFAERSTRGFFKAFFETWKLVAVEPQRFFAHVRIDQVGSAILFGVLASWVGGTVGALLNALALRAQIGQVRGQLSGLPAGAAELVQRYLEAAASGTVAGAEAVLGPILVVVLMFVGAGILHVLLLALRGANRGFSATLTVVAFSYGVQLVAAVPQCGGAIAFVWQMVVLILGLAAVHRTQVWKSATVVLGPLIVCCCCGSLSAASMLASIASRAAGGSTEI
jgi:DNA-directed RNA polymerase subunit RPC12/RpoP